MTKRQLTFVVAGAAVFAAVAVTARATSSSGVVSAAIQARAAFADPVDIKFKVGAGEVIHVRESRDTVMQKIVLGPGGHTGWHSHHGPAVVLVKAGALTLFSGDDPTCTGRTYPAGQAFVDSGQGHVHIGRNLSSTDDVELWVTYFDVPPPPGSVRVDVDDPGNCTF